MYDGNEVGQDIQKHSSVSFIQVNFEAWIRIGNYLNMVDILQYLFANCLQHEDYT